MHFNVSGSLKFLENKKIISQLTGQTHDVVDLGTANCGGRRHGEASDYGNRNEPDQYTHVEQSK